MVERHSAITQAGQARQPGGVSEAVHSGIEIDLKKGAHAGIHFRNSRNVKNDAPQTRDTGFLPQG